jgi:AmmeMemoRadiSam system protein B
MATSHAETVRPSVIAGSWYPGTEKSLARTVDEYLAQVDQDPIPGELLGLISPHAGYVYSGQTAAYAYHQLAGRAFETVVLMGPSHRAWVGEVATNTEDAYATPLGAVPLDRDFIAALEQRLTLHTVHRDAEHSLEIQLPFLQRQLKPFALVPLLMNADEPQAAQRLAATLAQVIQQRAAEGKRTLLVASSDLHHIPDYTEVVRRDRAVVEAVDAYDLEALTQRLMDPRSTVCGRIPILTVLHAARQLGADAARVLHYTNSGDVTGQRTPGQYTVGYMAAAVYRS